MIGRAHEGAAILGPSRAVTFEVICAGEALWALSPARSGRRLRFRPSGGAVNAAVALARAGLRVGLAAAMADDASGRALVDRVGAAGVDVGGVTLARVPPGLVVVDQIEGASRVLAHRVEDHLPVMIPAVWSAPLLLLSGLSPALAPMAALCKAARAARREGAIVVVDVNARREVWAGHDARVIRAILGEASVVRASGADLAALACGPDALRAAMRRDATLVSTDGPGLAVATGPFGEVAQRPEAVSRVHLPGAGDAFTAALCAELVRSGGRGGGRAETWDRALRRAHASAMGLRPA
jgi:sugar/nucleoside kinase (ribokinase family)